MTVLLPVTRYLQIFRQSWFSGVLSVLFLSIALIMLRIDTQQARTHTASLEIVGRIHANIQHLTIVSPEALRGNEQAFVQLRNNLDQLNHYATLLQYGGEYQRETLPAIAELLPADLFKTFRNTLRIKENRARQILESREALVSLAEILKRVDLVNHGLQKKVAGILCRTDTDRARIQPGSSSRNRKNSCPVHYRQCPFSDRGRVPGFQPGGSAVS